MNIESQSKIREEISNIFKIFIASEGKIKPHFILTGESGCGKSFLINSLAEEHDLNFMDINTAQLTKEGVSGNSLSKVLSPMINFKNKLTVIFCDEFDKLFCSSNIKEDNMNNIATAGVQNEFLKLLESNKASVYGDYGKYVNIDISKTLFVFAGAFNNDNDINSDKLREYGVKTEFLGRVGLIYNLNKLTLKDLWKILENSCLLDEYLKIYDNVEKERVVSDIKKFLEKIYPKNDIGARIINFLIHKWFLNGGKLEEPKEQISFSGGVGNKLKINIDKESF